MLQANFNLQLLAHHSPQARAVSPRQVQRSQSQAASPQSIESLYESLPAEISANKRAIINRLIALHEQGASG